MADAYSFTASLPTQKDLVRLRVGDTNGLPQWFLADETINGLLQLYPYDEVCAQCAESIGAICAQLASEVSQRNLRITYQQRSKAMYDLADRIRDLAAPLPGAPVNTGAASAHMQSPNLQNYLVALPPCDPNNPRLPGPGVP